MADELAGRATSWLQALWARRTVDALAQAGALPETCMQVRYGPAAEPQPVLAWAMRSRLAETTAGDALSEACEALEDLLAMALLRDRLRDGVGSVLDTARQPVLVTDGDRWCVDANAPAAALLGTSRTDIRLRRLDDFVPARCRDRLARRWASPDRGPTSSGALPLVAAEGREVIAGCTAVALAADRHLIVVERIDGVRFGRWTAKPPSRTEPPRAAVLRPREREILTLVASGRTSAGIATHLRLSRNTVETHIRNAVVRLGAANRTHATVIALLAGEIAPPGAPAGVAGARRREGGP
jgi:DNA-binding CsgD family transcriptional regulator